MKKPIFRNRWYRRKPPQLQIKILKSIVISGELSKSKAADILKSNYSVISDAMDALIKRGFIKWSHDDASSRRAEKFYKITESGLRSLLAVNLSEEEFWKVILLLSISSKRDIKESEFEEYYRQFENNRLGHSSIHGYFFQSDFFNHILDQWLLNNNNKDGESSSSSRPLVQIPQIVIECLALNCSLTLQQLVEKSGLQQEQINRVLDNYSIQSNGFSSLLNNLIPNLQSDTESQRRVYSDYIMHTLIVSKEADDKTTFELSLFGIMLVISLVRYYYMGIDTTRCSKLGILEYIPNLFYKDIDLDKYYDKIAYNYKKKIPYLFGKWNLLKSQLGSKLLYDNFDLFIYKEDRFIRNMNETIWFGGNKEFHDDLRSLTQDARNKLYIIHLTGSHTLERFKKRMDIINYPNIGPLYRKIIELGEILIYADISSFLDAIKGSMTTSESPPWTPHINQIETIERVFRDELTFFFYLNLNTTVFTRNKADLLKGQSLLIPDISQRIAEYEEALRLGISPKQRLMAILTKDKDIKQWFFGWIEDIMNYRKQTSYKMSEFYNEVIKSHENVRKQQVKKSDEEAVVDMSHEEYNITKICSEIDSIYST